jgi:hypothetical protein
MEKLFKILDGSRLSLICNNLKPLLTGCKKIVRSLVYTPHKTFSWRKNEWIKKWKKRRDSLHISDNKLPAATHWDE